MARPIYVFGPTGVGSTKPFGNGLASVPVNVSPLSVEGIRFVRWLKPAWLAWLPSIPTTSLKMP